MRVEFCTCPQTWDAYVAGCPVASHCHRWAWKHVIEECYGHPTFYLAARADGAIEGVLPLVSIRSWLFGHFLVSLPFLNYGGLLASTTEAETKLKQKAVELARQLDARHIELRQGDPWEGGWKGVSAKVAMWVELPSEIDELWDRIGSRMRNKVRKAGKHGLQTEWTGPEGVGDFYRVFATNMRNLGTPVYPRRWFTSVCRHLGDDCRILLLRDGNKPVAATLLTGFRDVLELPWIASVPEARQKYSSVLLYWTALEWAWKQGYRWVDLGRCTPGGGVHRFKQQWGCVEKPLHWYYWLAEGRPVPHLRPDNPRYRLAIRVWQHLPLAVANRLGPQIVRSIP